MIEQINKEESDYNQMLQNMKKMIQTIYDNIETLIDPEQKSQEKPTVEIEQESDEEIVEQQTIKIDIKQEKKKKHKKKKHKKKQKQHVLTNI